VRVECAVVHGEALSGRAEGGRREKRQEVGEERMVKEKDAHRGRERREPDWPKRERMNRPDAGMRLTIGSPWAGASSTTWAEGISGSAL